MKQPLFMVWGEKPYEDAYIVKNEKSKRALNAYYTANVGANTVNTLDVQNRKNSIFKSLSTLESSDIVKAMRFDDMESSYSGLNEPNGKHVYDSLAIMFLGHMTMEKRLYRRNLFHTLLVGKT